METLRQATNREVTVTPALRREKMIGYRDEDIKLRNFTLGIKNLSYYYKYWFINNAKLAMGKNRTVGDMVYFCDERTYLESCHSSDLNLPRRASQRCQRFAALNVSACSMYILVAGNNNIVLQKWIVYRKLEETGREW